MKKFDRPFLPLFSDSQSITGGLKIVLQTMILGAKNQAHAIITEAEHFLYKDKPHEIVQHLIKFITDNSLSRESSQIESFISFSCIDDSTN